ncbi:PiT family inorganic phosphate transporter [Exophiala aquamarina CBS 119918]|uniref:Phosphate transporter n=1 Tax=Exophiala aquamarina CBS 119918 TaxID=1182545 RepID=A0A072P4W1_9EURO|nr:PiT family inorganic phosphate transporter [Exophiala aquamarina CBS 119918]KEF55154.1 PiT family inorganic phosphate transporter [Exophiala aquamarina CBS 119918]
MPSILSPGLRAAPGVAAAVVRRAPAITARYDWILAITTIAFIFSSFGNGANDVANSYATSVAARTLTMPQVGFLSVITEFVGAVALGSRVTGTIKNNIIGISRFTNAENPGTLMLIMGCSEVGSATWLMLATYLGFPVSTTQTVVGALIGSGFASQASIKWEWTSGSVSQVAASWGIAPAIAAAFAALIFGIVKYTVLERKDSFKWAMRLIPFYIATTCSILALFIVVEAPTAPSLEEFGAGKAVGIILGVWAGMLLVSYIFFVPYFERRLIREDNTVKFYHIPLGPLLRRQGPPLYFPAKHSEKFVIDYYEDSYGTSSTDSIAAEKRDIQLKQGDNGDIPQEPSTTDTSVLEKGDITPANESRPVLRKRALTPEERFLQPNAHLSVLHPQRLLGYLKFALLQGVTRDCVSHDSAKLREIHARASKYDVRVEHLWTYCQVASAIMMSIAHGSNDVANAVGPWAATYATYQSGEVNTRSPTPVWMLVVAGFLLGAGFWFYGYHIIRALGNKITQMSPTRGFSVELGAAITVLLASRLGLPVSTTQCLVGATMGVALMNYDFGAVNWRQLLFIFCGWVLTLPSAGLISGLLCVMALNTPHF